ncbi:MAG: hypothetical protein KKG33_05815 [candidate division Zixibacteria bacterium]|nr:hypothetical protein [candidate division Zixibacteria bacterium]MBU1471023.1 hypothetical protein [candidate division Zixibacteria bacterium]MBU2625058.1 hypothetical protein [candidate division Zixibacteria bacterium]
MHFDIGIWIGAFLTLGIISFLYKDNPWYKICEAIFIGISAGYWIVSLWWQNLVSKLWDNLWPALVALGHGEIQYNLLYLVAGILGIMMLMRLVPQIGWISRWPLALVIGATAGLQFVNYLVSNGVKQIYNTIVPLFGPISDAGGIAPVASVWAGLGNTLILVGTFTGLVYFFFSKEHKGLFGGAAKVGTWFLMITFGASFGYTVMSRMSLLIGRIDFLVNDWIRGIFS